jgi:hypothetical protein
MQVAAAEATAPAKKAVATKTRRPRRAATSAHPATAVPGAERRASTAQRLQ